MTHHTKEKGDLGVLRAQVEIAEQGWMVLLPLTEHSPFDLVAYKNGVFKRIQVKYRTARNNTVEVTFTSSWSDKHGSHRRFVDKNDFDLYCIYCPDTNKCYFVDPNKYREGVSLRLGDTKNNQKKGVHFASDFCTIK